MNFPHILTGARGWQTDFCSGDEGAVNDDAAPGALLELASGGTVVGQKIPGRVDRSPAQGHVETARSKDKDVFVQSLSGRRRGFPIFLRILAFGFGRNQLTLPSKISTFSGNFFFPRSSHCSEWLRKGLKTRRQETCAVRIVMACSKIFGSCGRNTLAAGKKQCNTSPPREERTA
ncbi:MAG: hypothetical protein KGJ60_00210 [Verrucomicrobiota bacterium]|nr:hypothetical protein [Verrucomicrobiota bacterium]